MPPSFVIPFIDPQPSFEARLSISPNVRARTERKDGVIGLIEGN
jgi:hypothetical protein